MNDHRLIRRLRKGETKAYQYLFSEYYDWLCSYIYNLCRNRNLSEDIVQEVMIHFWEKREVIMITSSLKNYLFMACHNHLLQHIRHEKMQLITLGNIRWDVISEATLEDDLYDYRMEKLMTLINHLPPKCKEIFIHNKLEKKKYKEIALHMGISVKTVENQMSKALHFLKANTTC